MLKTISPLLVGVMLCASTLASPLNQPIKSQSTPSQIIKKEPSRGNPAAEVWHKSKQLKQLAKVSPSEIVRVIVRLKQDNLSQFSLKKSFQGAQRSASQVSQLQSHKTALLQSQNLLIQQWHKDGLVDKVNHQFTALTNAVALSTQRKNLNLLRQNPLVEAAFIDHKVTVEGDNGLELINAPSVWALKDANGVAVKGEGITVAIIDTGIDYTHKDLGAGFGGQFKVIGGYDFANQDDDPIDDHGHGTHVAGIVAADGVIVGVAPKASLYAFKVLDEYGGGWESDIIAAIERASDPDQSPATDDKVDIINMSLGGWGEPTGPLSEAANNAVANGITVVAAAGNSGQYNTILSPGNAEHVITVAASDSEDAITYFSSRGPVENADYIKPDITAPGFEINSTTPDQSSESFSGTSMAAPHVAGAVALIKQLMPDKTPAQIKSLLVSNAVDLGEDIFTQGGGRVDILAAAQARFMVEPPLISFGDVAVMTDDWTAEHTVQITNMTDEQQTYSVVVNGTLPEGAKIEVTAPAEIVLSAGASVDVVATLHVDNTKLPFSDNASLSFESSLLVQNGNQNITIPVAFHKAALLKIKYHEAAIYSIVYDNELDYFNFLFAGDGNTVVRLKPGNYNIATWFWDFQILQNNEFSLDRYFNIENDLKLDDVLEITEAISEAPLAISVSGLISPSGQSVDMEMIEQHTVLVNIKDTQLDLSFSDVIDSDSVGHYSRLSDRYEVSVTGMLEDATQSINQRVFYQFYENSSGLDSSLDIIADTTDAGKVEIGYYDRTNLANGVALDLVIMDFGLYGPSGLWAGLPEQRYYSPFGVTIYGPQESANRPYSYIDGYFLTDLVDDNVSWLRLVGHTQPMRYVAGDQSEKVQWDFDFWTWLFDEEDLSPPESTISTVATFDSPQSKVMPSFRYWAGKTYYFKALNMLMVDRLTGYGWDDKIRDMWQNSFRTDLAYQFSCDGNDIIREAQNVWWVFVEVPEDCVEPRLLVSYKSQLMDLHADAFADISLVPSDELYSTAPAVESIVIRNEGEISSIVSSADNQIAVDVHSDYTLSSVTLELKINDQWTTLSHQLQQGLYVAQLPLPQGDNIGSLRISAVDEHQNSLVNTINSAIYIGTDVLSHADYDGDGIADIEDAFPDDPYESLDTDNDGIGNGADDDDDNDGFADSHDSFPLDPQEHQDFDGDGVGDNADLDDDGDGIADVDDEFPFDANNTVLVTELQFSAATIEKNVSSGGGLFYLCLLMLVGGLIRRTRKVG